MGVILAPVSIAMGHSDLATTRAYCHAAEKPASEYLGECTSVSYTHLTLPTKRIV